MPIKQLHKVDEYSAQTFVRIYTRENILVSPSTIICVILTGIWKMIYDSVKLDIKSYILEFEELM